MGNIILMLCYITNLNYGMHVKGFLHHRRSSSLFLSHANISCSNGCLLPGNSQLQRTHEAKQRESFYYSLTTFHTSVFSIGSSELGTSLLPVSVNLTYIQPSAFLPTIFLQRIIKPTSLSTTLLLPILQTSVPSSHIKCVDLELLNVSRKQTFNLSTV